MKYVFRLFVLGGLLGLLLFAGCQEAPDEPSRKIATYPNPVEGEPSIRVLAQESTQPMDLLVPGAYSLKVVGLDGAVQTANPQNPVTVSVSVVKDGVKVGLNVYKSAEITPQQGNLSLRFLQTGAGGKQTLTQKVYPGTFVFQRSAAGKLQMIIRMPLEQYLVGVVPGEMELSSAPEALKAQAVAARTFALYQIRTSTGKPYDVHSDVRSQSWKPEAQADPRARMAVNSTRGVVLTENYRVFPAYFSADCGGVTSNGRYVFSGSDIVALQGGVECPHAAQAWKQTQFALTREDLSARLAKAGIVNGRVLRLECLDEKQQRLNVLARVYFVRVVTETGVEKVIPATTFRLAVGPGKQELSSTCFLVRPSPNNPNLLQFESRGNGHGVGMCQQGAKLMGTNGSDYIEILSRYYINARLLRLW